MYINKNGLSEKDKKRFEELVRESFRVLNDLIGIDESEDIYFDVNEDFKNEFGRVINLLGFRVLYDLSGIEGEQLLDMWSTIKNNICKEYETMVVINKKHLNEEDDKEIINTLIHEILHHLTNEEEEQHGTRWKDLAKYVSNNSIYCIEETISDEFCYSKNMRL